MTGERQHRIGPFTFDAATGELVGEGVATRLAPKAAQLLAILAERPGELVTRERLQEALWPGQHVELDQALAYTVRQVRAALGDDGSRPRFLETLPKRGYRLRLEASSPSPAQAPTDPEARPTPARRRAAVLVAVVAVALGAAVALWPPRAATRVAVLPLGESSNGTADAAVDDALTEALVVALTAHSSLAVLGPATTAPFRATPRPHTDVGRELGVAFVVSGGFRPRESAVFLQIVRVDDGAHVFADLVPLATAGGAPPLAGVAAAMVESMAPGRQGLRGPRSAG